MTPEQATFLLNEIYLPQIHNEHKTTKRVIEAVPADKCDWTPAEDSMRAFELAAHIAGSEIFFINGVLNGAFDPAQGKPPESAKTPAALAEWHDQKFKEAATKLTGLTGDELLRSIDFRGVFNFPAIVYIGLMCNHSVHHRGQLSTYLRPMGAKVPRIYGGSKDEPMQMPAQA